MNRQISLYILILALLTLAGPALAHKVVVFAWTEQGMVHVEGGFGSKRPAKQCMIKAMDSENRLIYQGKTDDQGCDSFPLPTEISAPLTITLEAGPGHKGQWVLEKEDLLAQEPNKAVNQKKHKPSDTVTPGRIAGGIALIFGLVFLIQQIKKRKA